MPMGYSERPYRSHSRPACTACRRRKSRCRIEAQATACLMCGVHGTECRFPHGPITSSSMAAPRRPRTTSSRPIEETATTPATIVHAAPVPPAPPYPLLSPGAQSTTVSSQREEDGPAQTTPLSLHHADDGDDNPHIVGPVVSNDSTVLADYLSSIHAEARGMRITRPVMDTVNSEPVIFTHVQKRPLGVTVSHDVAFLKLQMIEKLLEPWADHLIDIYLVKPNACFPLVDEASFRTQYLRAKHRVSPALLASLYAHTLTFWSHDPRLSSQRCPDGRFIWNLANEALYSELYTSPGISTITAILLNIGGRPTTSMIGNGVQLGAAVSLSHSLGLNRNPLSWDIPQAERHLRMKIWWCLLVHDRWSSLAYGTPPHIRDSQYDVPPPTEACLCSPTDPPERRKTARIFIALVGLTEVLAHYLEHIYRAKPADPDQPGRNFELALNAWVEALPDDVRRIIVRGTQLDTPGASNLRLAYLSVRLLLHRIGLNSDKRREVGESLSNRYMEIRRSAEEIVLLVQELSSVQLGDFWLPVAAITFSHTAAFLTRCALEADIGGGAEESGLAQSPSLRMASELLAALQHHRERSGWDLADICLAQHTDVVERLLTTPPGGEQQQLADVQLQGQQYGMYSGAFVDALFPSIWDTLQSI
ncbi:Zn(2)-C6 fungal-type DNA-binding domain [Pleurostoma richardsiae]|uniref:Zn(2)-C6 fungal-type DNA-binding domain n=1 Tax=Pleurostoma richardsiae TaxID=41990 RepID=A0AA38RFI8_9PEZI|nr:Zn(2)-C6 fungal-type DNA-binding domain [Pleurostoma richardsiae]